VLVRCPNPPDIIRLPVPIGLTAVVVHPDLEIETAKARALLGDSVPLSDAIQQWANLGAFVDGLHRSDFAQISRSLEDTIAEPRRASLVPGLAAIKRAAVEAGALGCSLSGSGPSLFALCRVEADARPVAEAMEKAVAAEIGGESQTYVSSIAPQGARVVSACVS
jgi:homoserine kinase